MRFVRHFPLFAALTGVAAMALAQQTDPKKDPDQIGNRRVDKGLNWYSIDKEMALGKAWAQQVQKEAQVVEDPVISEYVNRLGQNLARNSDSKFPLTIHVIRDETPNAMSLPGGFFFVNTGLILTAGSEAELAGGMAHEIAHIAARHVTRELTRQQAAQLATIPLIFIGGWAGYGTRQGAGAMLPLAFRHFDRAFETEADLLGLQYIYKTGYDPNGMIDIFEKIDAFNQKKTGRIAQLFADHPLTQDRIVTVQKNIQDLLKSQPQYVVSTSEFSEVKARLKMLERRRKVAPQDDPNRPQLRRAPDRNLQAGL